LRAPDPSMTGLMDGPRQLIGVTQELTLAA
jgi:hypothetical protein